MQESLGRDTMWHTAGSPGRPEVEAIPLDAVTTAGKLQELAESGWLVLLVSRVGTDDPMPSPRQSSSIGDRVRTIIEFGGLRMNYGSREVHAHGRRLCVSEREIRILQILMQEPRTAHSYPRLLEAGWGAEYASDVGLLRAAMKRLRRKLRVADVAARIEAARGYGFRLVEE